MAGDIQAAAFGAGMFFEVAKGLNIVDGPGVEISEEEDEHGAEGEGQDTETKFEFLWRFGASYERELGRGWSVGGAVCVDLVTSGKTPVVVGLSLGKSFQRGSVQTPPGALPICQLSRRRSCSRSPRGRVRSARLRAGLRRPAHMSGGTVCSRSVTPRTRAAWRGSPWR